MEEETISASAVQEYLEMTGQSSDELLAGAEAFGVSFIYGTLVPQALAEGRKIIWQDLDPEGHGIGAMTYSLEDL